MASQADIPALLRFLTQDAKVPLASAMTLVKPLQSSSLASPSSLASSNLATLTPIFKTQDDAKRVLNAAKRKAKRPSSNEEPSPRKKRKLSPGADEERNSLELEASLVLPKPETDECLLTGVTLITNRAPLLLAFTLTLLEYTMPRQPLSSRLSLAQAQVSQGARAKAKSLGIEKGMSAEEEGWGAGQPVVRVMGKEVRVVRRADSPLELPERSTTTLDIEQEGDGQQKSECRDTSGNQEQSARDENVDGEQYALWALDLEALKSSKSEMVSSTSRRNGAGLPIYSPHSARAYIMKAFTSSPSVAADSVKSETDETDKKPTKPKKPKSEAKQKEENLGLLLGALKLLFDSWSTNLKSEELGRRAWTWYMNVRPPVEHGPAGWGGKGEVRLVSILDLRRSHVE